VTCFRSFRAGAAAVAAVVLTGFALVSCSNGVKGPDAVVDRMLEAYGCPGNLPLLTSFAGKGFLKQVPLGHVAMSYPFDIYQRESLYKTKAWLIREGMPVDMQVFAVGDTARTRWTYSGGYTSVPQWEVDLVGYRFPLVLKWLSSSAPEGRLVEGGPEDGARRIRFEKDGDLLTLVVDSETWLLRGMVLENAADSTFRFEEMYGDYRKVDGIWFPNRFTARFQEIQYYEFLIPTIELGADLPDRIFAVLPEDTILPPPAGAAE
jgi:hypothetical protein